MFLALRWPLSIKALVNPRAHVTPCLRQTVLKTLAHNRPIYTTETFWHGSDKNGTHTPKNGLARINFAV